MGKFSEFFGVLFNAPFLLSSGHCCSLSLNTAHVSSFINNLSRTQKTPLWLDGIGLVPHISIFTNALQKFFLAVVRAAHAYSPRNASHFPHFLQCTGHLCLNYFSLAYPLPPKMSLYSAEMTKFPTYFFDISLFWIALSALIQMTLFANIINALWLTLAGH